MKKIIFLQLIFIVFAIILTGCVEFSKLTFERDVSFVKIQIGEKYKIISDQSEINELISLIEESNFIEKEMVKNIPYYKIDVVLHPQHGLETKKITLIKNVLIYNGSFYEDGRNLFSKFEKKYLNINSPELIDPQTSEEISNIKLNRRKLSTKEALKGYWINNEGESIYFKNDQLHQGEYAFNYSLELLEKSGKYIHISVFRLNDSYANESKLFDMYINIDETNNNLKLEKRIGGLTYNNNMIFIDENNNRIGDFQGDFFE